MTRGGQAHAGCWAYHWISLPLSLFRSEKSDGQTRQSFTACIDTYPHRPLDDTKVAEKVETKSCGGWRGLPCCKNTKYAVQGHRRNVSQLWDQQFFNIASEFTLGLSVRAAFCLMIIAQQSLSRSPMCFCTKNYT